MYTYNDYLETLDNWYEEIEWTNMLFSEGDLSESEYNARVGELMRCKPEW